MPAAAFLQESDLPAAYQYGGDFWPGDTTFNGCTIGGRSTPLPASLTEAVPFAGHGTHFRAEGSSPGQSRFVAEWVGRYAAADAASYIDWVREVVAYCGGGWAIAAESFAGDASLIIYHTDPARFTYIFVRVGPLVAQILYEAVDSTDPAVIGRRAAARLCAGTTAC
ncbi:MAG TPA: hypothetical protein VF163_15505 [Micromonosporaceae bacterium]